MFQGRTDGNIEDAPGAMLKIEGSPQGRIRPWVDHDWPAASGSIEARQVAIRGVVAHQPVDALDRIERGLDGALQPMCRGARGGDLHERPKQRARAPNAIVRVFHSGSRSV